MIRYHGTSIYYGKMVYNGCLLLQLYSCSTAGPLGRILLPLYSLAIILYDLPDFSIWLWILTF